MMRLRLWERHFLAETLKVFFFFLGAFFFLYAAMDYSTHMQDFIRDKRIQVADVALYYGYQFVKRADLLIPLALLVATVKVAGTLNIRREWTALQASGVSTKTLCRPFFLAAACCTLFSYWNFEVLMPQSLNFLDAFHRAHFRHSHRGHRKVPLHTLYLKDGSKLVYQYYEPSRDAFFDAVWIRSAGDLWRMKYLSADPSHPVGTCVDHFTRSPQGVLEKTASFDSHPFGALKWSKEMPQRGIVPIENRSLSELYRLAFHKTTTTAFQAPEVRSHFYFKCAMPLLPLLAVLACLPFCVRYTRHLPLFFIYAAALFSFIAFFTLMDAAVILGENQVLPPFLAISLPLILAGSGFGWKFAKTH
jgi:lipopolysaccharide export system permease protein